MKADRLGGPYHQQTEVRGLQNGQVLPASNRYRRIGHHRSTLLCYGCIRYRVQGRPNDGNMRTTGVKKEEEGERMHS